MIAARALAIGLAALLAACGPRGDAGQPVPDPPLPVSTEDPLAGPLASAAGRLETHIMAEMGDTRGKPQVRRHLLPDAKAAADLRAWYADRAEKAGWKAIGGLQAGLSRGEKAFGYEACGQALVIGWVEGGQQVPAIAVRYGGPDARC